MPEKELVETQSDPERAERILAAAHELLLAWGFKRVTVDEIAHRARVGKGTVYLHWKTKEALFAELLRQEFGEVVTAVTTTIDQDLSAARPGRLIREVFLQQSRRPLAQAIHAGDSDILGVLTMSARGLPIARELGFHNLLTRLVEIWREHGLLQRTASQAEQIYTIDAVLSGFITGGIMVASDHEFSTTTRADLLGSTIRAAVEQSGEPAAPAIRSTARDVLVALAAVRGVCSG